MQVNVAQLLKEPVGSIRKILVEGEVGYAGSDHFNVKGTITLTHTNKGIMANGNLVSRVNGKCCRCLTETENIMEFNLEEEYLPTIDIVSGLPLPLKEETFIIDSHHNVDLDIALYQYACMSVPMKILCKEDCSGLCSICGENLNEHLCKCAQGRIDNH